MVIEYHKTEKMSIDTADFCEYFRRLGARRIYWQYPASPPAVLALWLYTYKERKVPPMKIVVLRSPAVLAPILRRMFGIRKEKKR